MELRLNVKMQNRVTAIQSRLLATRLDAEISQEAVADALGVSSRTLRDWERSYDSPSLEHALGWARELNLRFALKDRVGISIPPPAAPEENASWEKREMRRLAQPLKTRREARRISQASLALIIGTTRETVRRWEDVAHLPRNLITMVAWADRLDFTLKLETRPRTPEGYPSCG